MRGAVGVLVVVMSLTLAGRSAAQVKESPLGPDGKCIIDFQASQNGDTTRANIVQLPTGKYNAYIGGGFVGVCRGQDVHLVSDSAEYYGDANLLYLIGRVHYTEPRAKLDADHMTYWTAEGHLKAEGNVYGVMNNGTTMRGPVADYYRIVPGLRAQTLLVTTGRPKIGIVQRDSVTGKISDTVHVEADRVTTIADSVTYAGGTVHITRPEMFAHGDSAFMDNGTGRARLIGNPSVEARRTRPFTLTGGVIDVYSTNKQVDRVVAAPKGHATSQDLELFADSIDLRVTANVLQRAMAWGATRARAVSPTQEILADSIDAILPDQRIRELRAVRKAYATAVPDTSSIITTDRDWMLGDTITARFDTVATGDTSHTPPVRTIMARVNARAYYHIPNDRDKTKPGLNYVVGRAIDVDFLNREVQTVSVSDSAGGVYLEPVSDSVAAKPVNRPGQPRSAPSRPSGRGALPIRRP
jgi:hypothetical protein